MFEAARKYFLAASVSLLLVSCAALIVPSARLILRACLQRVCRAAKIIVDASVEGALIERVKVECFVVTDVVYAE